MATLIDDFISSVLCEGLPFRREYITINQIAMFAEFR